MIERLVPAASTYANQSDQLFDLIFWFVGFWFVVSVGIFFWLIFRFRRREGVPSQYVAGESKAEKRWVAIPHFLVLICDIFIIWGAVRLWYHVKQELPPAEATIRVIGQQWAWTFVHPGADNELDTQDDVVKVNELHVQADTLYHYKLEATDVLHNFSVPAFRLKQDAIPGRVITGWFEPTKTGEYDVQCAEICGIGHGLMGARVHVESAEEHAAWVAEESPIAVAAVAPDAVEE